MSIFSIFKRKPKMQESMTRYRILSAVAIIPCLALLALTYIVGGLAMIAADDLNRNMTMFEIILAMLWVVPVLWLILIVANWVCSKTSSRVK